MKNFFRLLLLFSATVTVIFSLSSCIVVDNPVVFRVPFEELKGGAYYGESPLFAFRYVDFAFGRGNPDCIPGS